MSLKLIPLEPGDHIERLAGELAPSFGGDESTAREVLFETLTILTREVRPKPWGCYLAEVEKRAVGTCAFKAQPDSDGAVEIAYMTFLACEGQGYATAMAEALCRIASAEGTSRVLAHTLPAENASNRVLRRSGFAFMGAVMDPEDGVVWRWERKV